MTNDESKQEEEWGRLYEVISGVLTRHGNEDSAGAGDYWIVDDNWGGRQHKIGINRLALLRPSVVRSLQALLREFPQWEIVVAVDVRGVGENWPDMGLKIRAHEIIDGLQRQHFPPEFQDLVYPSSRPGTERD